MGVSWTDEKPKVPVNAGIRHWGENDNIGCGGSLTQIVTFLAASIVVRIRKIFA